MIQLDSVVVVLMAEALVVLTMLLAVLFFLSRSRRGREMAEVDRFIDQMDEQSLVKQHRMEQFLAEDCGLPVETVESVLAAVLKAERALFQQIFRLFLQRDLATLADIERKIDELAEPYQNLLADRVESVTGAAGQVDKLAGLERVNQQLVRQLDTAMKTIDEISAEYTRVFSGNQTALELENSSKKMLQVFAEAEHSIRVNVSGEREK